MPHGLGHLLGLDVHEVGGYLPHFPPRSSKFGLKNLRTAWDLEENMCITIEPGLYFVEFLLTGKFDLGFNVSDYVNVDLAFEYRKEVAGVWIEDGVIVTKDGIDNLTQVPRSIVQIEACMRGEEWEHLPAEEF